MGGGSSKKKQSKTIPSTSATTPPMVPTTETTEQETPWEELLGSKNWESLLDPLDLSLRRLILRAGDFCQATYDAFNNDQNSKYCGSSRYGPKSFFHKVCLESAPNYKVVAFLYATAKIGVHEAFLLQGRSRDSWDRESNWIGYIAVTADEVAAVTGRREIYVAWRGTTRDYEWIDVLAARLESAQPLLRSKPLNMAEQSKTKQSTQKQSSDSDEEDDENVPRVMNGWITLYTSADPKSSFTNSSARTQLQSKIKELIDQYKDEKPSIILTGHSLGASLSVLSGFDLVENGITNIPITAFVFGCPQVGNKAFNDRIKQFPNLKILHIRNKIDLITRYPSGAFGYVDSGIDFEIDTRKSEFLKDSKNPGDFHNLQAMLHIVAGWNGEDGDLEMKVKRSLALVNKSSDFLKNECLVPASWWVEKNKGMVLDGNGDWVMAPPADEDIPIPLI